MLTWHSTTTSTYKTQYKVLRVWGFGDVNTLPPATNTDPNKVYFQVLNSTGSYINYGPDGLERLDYVVHSAEKHGVKLVLPFVNNWGDCTSFSFFLSLFLSRREFFKVSINVDA